MFVVLTTSLAYSISNILFLACACECRISDRAYDKMPMDGLITSIRSADQAQNGLISLYWLRQRSFVSFSVSSGTSIRR